MKVNCETLGKEHKWKPAQGGQIENAILARAVRHWVICRVCGWATAPALQEKGWRPHP